MKILSALLIVLSSVIVLLSSGCSSSNDTIKNKANTATEHKHDFSVEKAESPYLREEASCTDPAKYFYSCKCGETGDDFFSYGETIPHMFTGKSTLSKYLCREATKTSPAKYYYSCEWCKTKGTETFEHGSPLQDRWDYNYYVDFEFKEETDEWYITTTEELDGTFENSATSDANLLAEILYDCNDEISIFLYEYADLDNLVKNSSSKYKDYYKIVVKNEKGETCEARGQMHPGGDRIYVIDTYHNSVLHLMKTSTNLKFFIQYEDSPTTQYRFDVDMNNFNVILANIL